MKKLTVNDPKTIRETSAEYKGKPFVVSVGAHTIRIGLKGSPRRSDYEVSYDQIFARGAKNAANMPDDTPTAAKSKAKLVRRGKLA